MSLTLYTATSSERSPQLWSAGDAVPGVVQMRWQVRFTQPPPWTTALVTSALRLANVHVGQCPCRVDLIRGAQVVGVGRRGGLGVHAAGARGWADHVTKSAGGVGTAALKTHAERVDLCDSCAQFNEQWGAFPGSNVGSLT